MTQDTRGSCCPSGIFGRVRKGFGRGEEDEASPEAFGARFLLARALLCGGGL